MGRRKQAKPIKRKLEDYDTEESLPITKKSNEGDVSHICKDTRLTTTQISVRIKSQISKMPNNQQPLDSSILSVSIPSISAIEERTDAVTPNQNQAKSCTSPLLMLEKSMKKFEPHKIKTSVVPISFSSTSPQYGNGLSALFQFVGRITGGSSVNAVHRRENEVDSILKCLQCGRAFHAMELLVKHMQETQHFNNLPKTYSSLVQMDRQKVLNIKLQMKSEGVKLACLKCGEMPQNIDKHLKDVHDVRSNADWLKSIRIVKPGEDILLSTIANDNAFTPASSPHLNKLMSLINTVDKK